jgi:hypothetical protein
MNFTWEWPRTFSTLPPVSEVIRIQDFLLTPFALSLSCYGAYICGDYNSKRIFAITQANGALQMARQIGSIPQRLVSFSEDEAGDIYAVGYEGTIYQLDFTEARLE